MNILQVLPYYAPAWGYGGPPRIMYELAIELIRRGHNVNVYTTDAYEKSRRIGLRNDIIDGVRISYYRNLSNYLAWHKKKFFPAGFRGAVKKHIRDFDIVHISSVRNYLNLVSYHYLKKNGIPYAVDAHGSLPVATKSLSGAAKYFDKIFTGRFVDDAALLFAQTDHEASMYSRFTDKKAEILPLAVSLGEFENLPLKGEFRRRYGVKSDEKIITFLGRINRGKGLDLLIKIYSKLLQGISCLKLVIAGRDDGYLDRVRDTVENAGLSDKIILTGAMYGEQKMELYVDSDLFLFTPVYWEETSVASLEAMACGTPAVVTRQADIPYLEEYEAGYVVNADDDITDICNKISYIIDDSSRLEQYSGNARRLIEERFSIKEMAARIEKLFMKAVN